MRRRKKIGGGVPDPEMVIRTCEKCGEPRVLEHYHVDAGTMPGPFIDTHHFRAKCACGETGIDGSDIEARPDLFKQAE